MTYLRLPQPFTTEEAAIGGVTRYALSRLVDEEALLRLARGLYVDRELWESWWPSERAAAAAAAAARVVAGATASHSSATVLRNLPLPRLPVFPVHVTVPDLRTTPDTAWYRVHHGWLPREQIEVVGGIAVTTVTRTVVDTIRQVRTADGLAVADSAVAQGETTLEALHALRRSQTRWRNVTRVDDVLHLVDPRRESWLESVSAVSFDLDGVPPSTPQVEILSPSGEFIARVDDYWPLGVAGEADGRAKMTYDDDGRALAPDQVARRLRAANQRQARIEAQGVQMFRWTAEEAERPVLLASRYRAAAANALARPASPNVRCSCCHRALTECEVTRQLAAFRSRLRP